MDAMGCFPSSISEPYAHDSPDSGSITLFKCVQAFVDFLG